MTMVGESEKNEDGAMMKICVLGTTIVIVTKHFVYSQCCCTQRVS